MSYQEALAAALRLKSAVQQIESLIEQQIAAATESCRTERESGSAA